MALAPIALDYRPRKSLRCPLLMIDEHAGAVGHARDRARIAAAPCRCENEPLWDYSISMRAALRYTCAFALLAVLPGCVTTNVVPEMAWVRTDGRKIADDPALLRQGKTDLTLCHADLDAGGASGSARACMAKRGYALVQKVQAEELRAAYATAAQRKLKPPDDAER